ncbi:phosphopyruvate hydratase [Microbulbifer magnicolonia]|uniref:phosphopyruvate hydratase n=1 Tax=Microbulbifer magnicolonia TaxID=3109744 RepID=UPI002B40CC70|nr:phosphopyruvate hydratase [Microbulbifer sp. GG15]
MKIRSLVGRQVWDSRGRPTVEAEVRLTGGGFGRAIAPAGASTGGGEALDLRDGGRRLGGYGVNAAVAAINDCIAPALLGLDAGDQALLDQTMIELDGTPTRSRLGGNAMVAVSMAVAHAAASAAGMPLWQYLAGDRVHDIPLPEIQIFGGGAHARGSMDLQDFMVVPFGAGSFAEGLEWVAEVYLAAGRIMDQRGKCAGVADEGGYWPLFDNNEEAIRTLVEAIEQAGYDPATQMGISLDIAANQVHDGKGYFLKAERRHLCDEEWFEMMLRWVREYPVVSIEDPFIETDLASHAAFMAAVGDRVQVIGDDLLVTSAERVRAAAEAGACNTLLCKPNQAGTLTEAKQALDCAHQQGWNVIVSARSGETEDTSIVDLVYGWGARQFKVGSFARSERMAKWNAMIRLEEALRGRAVYAGAAPLYLGR